MGEDRFQAWIGEHLDALHRIARAFAAGADQQDLLQELLVTLWRAAPSFRGDSAPATFIFRVAHNRALTWRRGETRRRLRAEAYQRLHVEDENIKEPLLDRLYAAIRELEPLDRSLVLLSLEGQSYADIAALHGLSKSNVGARLSRARQKLIHLTEQDS